MQQQPLITKQKKVLEEPAKKKKTTYISKLGSLISLLVTKAKGQKRPKKEPKRKHKVYETLNDDSDSQMSMSMVEELKKTTSSIRSEGGKRKKKKKKKKKSKSQRKAPVAPVSRQRSATNQFYAYHDMLESEEDPYIYDDDKYVADPQLKSYSLTELTTRPYPKDINPSLRE